MATLAPTAVPETADPLDVSRPELYRDDEWQAPFARIRAAGGIHRTEHSAFGPYWSIASYKPIVHVESLPDLYMSGLGITIADLAEGDVRLPMFIAMDRPKHTGQRRTVAPAFTPSEMTRMTADIRRRTGELLDALPVGERFDWVDRVSIELTTQMLAILFDFPWADRRKLTFWSDWAGDIEIAKDPARKAERQGHLWDCAAYFTNLWNERIDRAPTPDLISMMIHSDAMSEMSREEFLGNLILLIVGGNDTTRNSMTAYAWGLHLFPDERAKLEADPALIPNATQEIIRWQTPLAYMRRVAKRDVHFGGQFIRKGDQVVMWYASGNRDERKFDDPDAFRIDRKNARNHMSFGFGVHRCMGNRLAEMQLRILWEELLARFDRIDVVGEPEYVQSNFVKGYDRMMVRVTRKAGVRETAARAEEPSAV